jgi:hypothetical protein
VASFVLAGMALLGWRGKRRQDAEKRLLLQAAESQRVMAGMMVGSFPPVPARNLGGPAPAAAPPPVPARTGAACPSGGETNRPGSRFCAGCGTALGFAPPAG